MPRGYRYAIFALVGLLVGTAQPKQAHGAEREKPSTKQAREQRSPPALPPIIRTISADDPDKGCADQKDDRASDLCAQWKAADAADSAKTATWIFGALGSLIGGATLFAAIMAARYARDAARETKRGADAAELAIQESRKAGEAQARAYLSVIQADISFSSMPAGKFDLPNFDTRLKLHNSGATPAVNVSYYCSSIVTDWLKRDTIPHIETVPSQEFVTNIAPHSSNVVPVIAFGIALRWREFVNRWNATTGDTPFGQMPMLVIYGIVFYDDVFGNAYRSKFAFMLEGDKTELPLKEDDLATVQALIPTFEMIESRTAFIKPDSQAEAS